MPARDAPPHHQSHEQSHKQSHKQSHEQSHEHPPEHSRERSREQAATLLTVVLAALVGGRRLLGEPDLPSRLLCLLPLPGVDRRARPNTTGAKLRHEPHRRREALRITGLPPVVELELRRRARLHGLSFANYLVAVLGQLAARVSPAPGLADSEDPLGSAGQAGPVCGPAFAGVPTPPRGQPPSRRPIHHLSKPRLNNRLTNRLPHLQLVLGAHDDRQPLERDIRPIPEMPDSE